MGPLTPVYFIALYRSIYRFSNVPKPLSFCEALRLLPYAVESEYTLNHSFRILPKSFHIRAHVSNKERYMPFQFSHFSTGSALRRCITFPSYSHRLRKTAPCRPYTQCALRPSGYDFTTLYTNGINRCQAHSGVSSRVLSPTLTCRMQIIILLTILVPHGRGIAPLILRS